MIPNLVSTTTSILSLWLALQAYAAPTDLVPVPGVKIPLRMRSPVAGRDLEEVGRVLKNQRDAAILKYSGQLPKAKRSSGYNLIVDQDADSGYYGTLAIGTPLTSYDVYLDTGSSDLWVVSNSCGAECSGIATFTASSSSSFKNLSTPFNIVYGSGQAAGYVAQDVVEMAGFSVSNQGFAVVDQVSTGLLSAPVSGLLGLAWQTISSSGEMPFWQSLASNGAMDSALFAIQLRRYSNASNPSALEPGGEISFGYTNSSLYTGSIDYVDIPGTPNYWYLNLASLTVQGASISLGSDTAAAIDTGTTNIAGPSSVIQAIYAQIPGSSAATGQFTGYYQFPCSTSVTVELSFGGQNWTMSPADFTYTAISSSECIGSFFEISSTSSTGGSSPSWIIGDAFLKNVYSVFQYSPPAIGFAQLSSVALAENGVNGAVPSATIGTVAAAVTNTSGAAPRLGYGAMSSLSVAVVMVLAALWMW